MAGVASAPGINSSPPYETESSTSRISREGRKISYQLTVIQQPERARACGSGAKSSTDRRPVDPPPIVRFQIYEGDGPNRTEITSPYNANFFLYATLENARPIAQGRVPPSPGVTNTPVLTGTPVAGMSYLDRPEKAGYFIFPDLSVRHEGKYRLSFTLFEDTKEDKDKDPIEANIGRSASDLSAVEACRRLEVKSSMFDVFSAKKFPGLSESTALSRLVADQGCRVRIRRDVRMRRRENKNPNDWDDYEDDTAIDRTRGASTPDPCGPSQRTPQAKVEAIERPRSASAATYSMTPQRRTSQQDMASQYYQSQVLSQPNSVPHHAGFVSQPSYYPPQSYHPQQYNPPPHMVQPVNAYPQYSYPAPIPAPLPVAPNYGYMPQQHVLPVYDQSIPHARHDNPAHVHPHASYDYQQNIPAPNSARHLDQNYAQTYPISQQNYSSSPNRLAATSVHSSTTVMANERSELPPIKNLPPTMDAYDPAPTMATYSENQAARAPQSLYAPQSNGMSSKRAYGSAFDTHHIDQPLRSGARPDTSNGYANVSIEESSSSDDDSQDMENFQMSYRRADGTQIIRPLRTY